MAAIHDLLAQIQDEELRSRIEKEIDKLTKQKKFGLVYEEHLPECTPLYDMPIIVGSKVMQNNDKTDRNLYIVMSIDGDKAVCGKRDNPSDQIVISTDKLVRVAEFGEPIFPYLKPMDIVCNAPNSELWHALIEADNYHALQLLEYLYAGKVDCIYIDPPYNTGARDWKYNNDYVDSNDSYSHSKWLSMMEKRLRIAKKLMNPKDSMLMITIDDVELCHLKILLDELFSECAIQIVDVVINPKGKARVGKLSQVDEYLILVYMGAASTIAEQSYEEGEEIRWPYLRRSDIESARGTKKGGINQFYPIYVNEKTEKIVAIGEPLSPDQPLESVQEVEGAIPVFPIREDGKHMNWGLTGESLQYAIDNGCVRVTKSSNTHQPYNFAYVTMPSIKKAIEGEYIIAGERDDGTRIILLPNGTEHQKPTAWKETHYDANAYGTKLIGKFLSEKRFSFPKSIYTVYDSLMIYLGNKKNALVVDFFAGSGTTLHSINMINAGDDGKRRCILVTNNEVSDKEAEELTKNGYKPGDEEWSRLGIARYVTWPRIKNSILGQSLDGEKVTGDYGIFKEEYERIKVKVLEDGKEKNKTFYQKKKVPVYPALENRALSDGFSANAIFFKLGFLDKTAIALGFQLKELIPLLWMKAGAYGQCPSYSNVEVPSFMLFSMNKFAVLVDESKYEEFKRNLENSPEIQTVFLVTDYDFNYKSMIKDLNVKTTFQLYRDYLDNFRINRVRNKR